MATQPTAIDPTKYRVVEYIGGRILQDRELKLMQQLEGDVPSDGKYVLGAVWKTGATLNVSVSVTNGTTVALKATNPAEPMLVYVNNNWEVFSAAPVTLAAGAAGSLSYVYLNWILWRVTYDGEQGTLEDASLIDPATHEGTAEMGQLQIYTGADDSGAVNTVLMFGRNTAPIPMAALVSNGAGVLTLSALTSVVDQMLADPVRPGMVTMTEPACSVAVAATDPRLSDARAPLPLSVNTAATEIPNSTGSTYTLTNTDQHGATQSTVFNTVSTGNNNGGINSRRLFYDVWSATVHDVLTMLWAKILAIWAVLANHEGRITTLEGVQTPTFSWHIGHKLGENTPNIAQSHPPVVDNSGDQYNTYPGFQVLGTPANPGGHGAFDVITSGGAINGQITHDGNFHISNPSLTPYLNNFGFTFSDYFSFATSVAALLKYGGQFPFSGDVTGSGPPYTTVQGLQGVPVSAAAPAASNVLTFNGSSWGPQPPPTFTPGGVNGTSIENGYFVFSINIVGTSNRMQVAFRSGTVANGGQIPLPDSNFSYAQMVAFVGPSVIASENANNNGSLARAQYSFNQSNGVCSAQIEGTNGNAWTNVTLQYLALIWRTGA